MVDPLITTSLSTIIIILVAVCKQFFNSSAGKRLEKNVLTVLNENLHQSKFLNELQALVVKNIHIIKKIKKQIDISGSIPDTPQALRRHFTLSRPVRSKSLDVENSV